LVSLDERAVEAFRQPNSDVRFGRLSSGHFVLFQELWQPTGRLVQGALLEPEAFLRALKAPLASLPAEAAALVAYNGTLLGSEERAGRAAAGRQLLYQYRAPPPFAGLELAFVSDRLSLGRSARLLGWLGLALAAVLVGGAGLLYRLGLGQLRLAARQRDFVAAVSHELKTPLTSIRMYGEMLASGLAAPERRDRYYRYILDESERLSRLIENVLQLARFERGESTLELAPVTVGDLFKQVRDRVAEPVSAAGFELQIDTPEPADLKIEADADALLQVFINLVDNAVKFAAGAAVKKIEISALRRGEKVLLGVRDFGPGIAADQRRRVFQRFYRVDNSPTREAAGTGIGLALVQELCSAMGAEVRVADAAPGARFTLHFSQTA
ncbi:MAG: HAMP domain-containing sensor histidine kinase, partial [Pseudomonadota bacterium]